ncbi:MAG TPA: NAD(P)-binding domain-containing protein, partial [Streptosporangiaceae bacterium]
MAKRDTSAGKPARAGAARAARAGTARTAETAAAQAAETVPARTAETVAVLGAGGTMGFAMARNIARAGIGVRAWNRTRGKAGPLA